MSGFLFYLAMNPTLLAGSIDARGIGCVVADMGSLDFDTGEIMGFGDDGTKGDRHRAGHGAPLAWSTNWPLGDPALIVVIETLHPNSLGLCALPLAMHSTSGAW